MSDFLSASAAAIYAIVSLNLWGIFIVWRKISLPKFKLKLGENAVEILDRDAADRPTKAAIAVIPPPTPPPPDSPTGIEQASTEVEVSTESNATTPLIEVLDLLFAAAREGGWKVRSVWSDVQPKVVNFTSDDRELIHTMYLAQLLRLGDESAVGELQSLSETQVHWRRPALRLAEYYRALESYALAEKWAKIAVARAVERGEHTNGYEELIEVFVGAKGVADLPVYAETLLVEAKLPQTRSLICASVAQKFLGIQLNDQAVLWYNRAIGEHPDDAHTRFNFAHALSKIEDYRVLSYWHYRILERASPNKSFVYNNIAYECEALKHPVLTGKYLEAAVRIDRNWATANVAIKFAEGGFIQSASKLLDDLGTEAGGNERVAEARKYIETIKATQESSQTELDKTAKAVGDFYSRAKHADKSKPDDVVGIYKEGPTAILEIAMGGSGRPVARLTSDGTHYQGELYHNLFGFAGTLNDQNRNRTLISSPPSKKTVQLSRPPGGTIVMLVTDHHEYSQELPSSVLKQLQVIEAV